MKVKVKDEKSGICVIQLEMLDSVGDFFSILAARQHMFTEKVTHTHTAREGAAYSTSAK